MCITARESVIDVPGRLGAGSIGVADFKGRVEEGSDGQARVRSVKHAGAADDANQLNLSTIHYLLN